MARRRVPSRSRWRTRAASCASSCMRAAAPRRGSCGPGSGSPRSASSVSASGSPAVPATATACGRAMPATWRSLGPHAHAGPRRHAHAGTHAPAHRHAPPHPNRDPRTARPAHRGPGAGWLSVVIEGTVTTAAGLLDGDGRRIAVQDVSGAIDRAHLPEGATPRTGTRIRATGTVGTYYDAPQLAVDDVIAETGRRAWPRCCCAAPPTRRGMAPGAGRRAHHGRQPRRRRVARRGESRRGGCAAHRGRRCGRHPLDGPRGGRHGDGHGHRPARLAHGVRSALHGGAAVTGRRQAGSRPAAHERRRDR